MARTTWFFMLFLMVLLAIGYRQMQQRLPGGAADVHYQNGFNLSQEGKHEAAMVELRRALKIEPSHQMARGKLAEELEAVGNYGDAVKQWLRLLREANAAKQEGVTRRDGYQLWYLHQHIGLCKLRMGDFKAAVQALDLALKTSPLKADLNLLLGEALGKQGDVKGAARAFLDVLQKAPQNSEAYQKLTELYKEQKLDEKLKELRERWGRK